ncbi:hypothetical protein M404DRAFT_23784 [Pisolithus tinctorius Marx 270]|uniref:Uncharacterized protein n=1 Tax=Pisolithus tinctorius Marx 270 TaxID=870435 RepID=A0A0C3P2P1_PISTI|nr:hypothetical protein M404DRAFT_23784 [Pisolithus tinctorius Marx 270]
MSTPESDSPSGLTTNLAGLINRTHFCQLPRATPDLWLVTPVSTSVLTSVVPAL